MVEVGSEPAHGASGPTVLWLVRHGITDAVGNWLSGRLAGVPLNREGTEQAARLGSFFASQALAAVYSSPLERALDTAAAISRPHGLTVVERADLTDIDFGQWTGSSLSELRNDPAFHRFNQQRALACPPKGEAAFEVQARVVRALSELTRLHPGSSLVVVAHADPLRAALAFLLGMSLDFAERLEISPGSATRLEIAANVRLCGLNHVPA